MDASRKRIGLAGCDAGRRLVTPLLTLARHERAQDIAAVGRIADERAAVGLVLGWPLNMDGSEGPAAKEALGLARVMARTLRLPVLLQDERLTTAAVLDAIAEGRVARPRKGAPTDHLAAAVILEDALRSLEMAALAVPGPVGPGLGAASS